MIPFLCLMINFCFLQLPPVWSFWEANIQVVPPFWGLLCGGKNWKLESWWSRVSDGTVTDPWGWYGKWPALFLEGLKPLPRCLTWTHFYVLFIALTVGRVSSLCSDLWRWEVPFIFNPLRNLCSPTHLPTFPFNYAMVDVGPPPPPLRLQETGVCAQFIKEYYSGVRIWRWVTFKRQILILFYLC